MLSIHNIPHKAHGKNIDEPIGWLNPFCPIHHNSSGNEQSDYRIYRQVLNLWL